MQLLQKHTIILSTILLWSCVSVFASVAKIGVGEFNNLYDASKACVTAGQKDYAERMNLITQSRNDYYAALGIPPDPPSGPVPPSPVRNARPIPHEKAIFVFDLQNY